MERRKAHSCRRHGRDRVIERWDKQRQRAQCTQVAGFLYGPLIKAQHMTKSPCELGGDLSALLDP